VLILSKIFVAVSLVGLLRCSEKFRRMSRELDEQVISSFKRIMYATEECACPPHLIPLLLLLTVLSFMLSTCLTAVGVR
jgi:hypothetical protein